MVCISFLVRFNIQSITQKRCFAFLFTLIWNLNFPAFCWSKIDFESIKLHVNKFQHNHPAFVWIYLFALYIIANWFYWSRFTRKLFLSGCLVNSLFHLISDREMHYKPNYSTTVANVYWIFFWLKSFVNTNQDGKQIGGCKRLRENWGEARVFVLLVFN